VLRAPLWTWVKVGLVLVALDVLVLRGGPFWRWDLRFYGGLGSVGWVNMHSVVRTLETYAPDPRTVIVTGSSVVFAGVNDELVNRQFKEAHVQAQVVSLSVFGSTATDAALLAAQGLKLQPWLVIYGAAARDFKKQGPLDTPVTRVLYDATLELPALPRRDGEARLDARVRQYWRLYRYRYFVRTGLLNLGEGFLRWLPGGSAVLAAPAVAPLPPEGRRFFLGQRVDANGFAAWQRWRASQRFEDYMAWLRASGGHVLDEYRAQTLASTGPENNPHLTSLQWMLGELHTRRVQTVLLYFPENPAFHAPEAAPYFDARLSQAWAEQFAREADAIGARFIDLRDFLAAEDFYDLIHPNLEGMRKLSGRLAEIVAEERQRTP